MESAYVAIFKVSWLFYIYISCVYNWQIASLFHHFEVFLAPVDPLFQFVDKADSRFDGSSNSLEIH